MQEQKVYKEQKKGEKMKKGICFLVSMLLLSTYTVAKDIAPVEPVPPRIQKTPLYIGFGLAASGVKSSYPNAGDESLKDTTIGGVVRVGWNFNDHIGIEFRGLKTRLEKDFSEVSHYGIYIKPQMHFENAVSLYGLAGYGITKVNYDHIDTKANIDTGTVSYGAGLAYHFAQKNAKKLKQVKVREETRMGKDGWVMDHELSTQDKPNDSYVDAQDAGVKGWGLWIDFQHILSAEGELDTDLNILSTGILFDF